MWGFTFTIRTMFFFPQQLTDARSTLHADAPHKSSSQPPPPFINHGTHAPQTPRGGLVQHLPLHHGQWIPLHSMWCWWAAAAAGRCRDRLFRGWGTGSAFHGRTHGSRSVLQVGRWGRVTARVFLCFSLGLAGIGVQTAGREAAGTCFNSRWWYDLVLGWLGLKAALLNGISVAQLA